MQEHVNCLPDTDIVTKLYFRELNAELLTFEEEQELAYVIRGYNKEIAALNIKLVQIIGFKENNEDFGFSLSLVILLTLNAIENKESEFRKVREKMIESNLRLVVSIVRKYVKKNVELSDLIQAGNTGLIEAVKKIRSG